MEKFLKLFPFLPDAKNVGKLVLALVFYLVGVSVLNVIITTVLALTIVLAPLVAVTCPLVGLYGLFGLVLSCLTFFGSDLVKK